MAFITGSDETGSIEYTLFPKTYNNYFNNISTGYLLKIRGRVEKRVNEYQIIVDRIKILEGDNDEEKE